jgi:hypothetical protein
MTPRANQRSDGRLRGDRAPRPLRRERVYKVVDVRPQVLALGEDDFQGQPILFVNGKPGEYTSDGGARDCNDAMRWRDDERNRRWLSRTLAPIGDELVPLWDELESKGYRLHALYRAAIRELAGGDEAYGQVERYWQEYAKERLAALIGPMDVRAGRLPDHTQYRSAFLDALRDSAAAPDAWALERGSSAEIEPTLRRHLGLYTTESPRKELLAAVKARRNDEIGLANVSASRCIGNSDREDYRSLVRCYTHEFSDHPFIAEKPTRSGTVFRAGLSHPDWDFCYIDLSAGAEGAGLDSILALCRRGVSVKPSQPGASAAATVTIGELIPGFQFYRVAQPVEARVLGVKAHVAAAAAIAARIDARLLSATFTRAGRAQG